MGSVPQETEAQDYRQEIERRIATMRRLKRKHGGGSPTAEEMDAESLPLATSETAEAVRGEKRRRVQMMAAELARLGQPITRANIATALGWHGERGRKCVGDHIRRLQLSGRFPWPLLDGNQWRARKK